MQSDGRHGVHVGFRNILNDNRNIEIPCPYGLVVRGCDEASVFINEGYRVYWSQMLIVFLSDFPRVHIIL